MEQSRSVYVLYRHEYEHFEVLGVFSSPEKFQDYVARRFPKTQVGSRWRGGNGEWRLTTPTWDYVATRLVVDGEPQT